MINRIGVAGYAGSGKTTVANKLVEEYGYKLLGFATPLYKLGAIHNTPWEEWHSRVYGWTLDYLKPAGYSLTERSRFHTNVLYVMDRVNVVEGKNRTLLQQLGTEVGRAMDENLWINLFESKVEELGPKAKIVNDNLRFFNEFDSLHRLGFVNVFIEVPQDIRASRYEAEYGVPMDQQQLSHSSEKDIEKIYKLCDMVYVNDKSKGEFLDFIDNLAKGTKEIKKELAKTKIVGL